MKTSEAYRKKLDKMSDAVRKKCASAKKSVPESSSSKKIPALMDMPNARSMRDNISHYLDAVTKKKKSFEVTLHGKSVAKLAPIKELPFGMVTKKDVTSTEIAQSKVSFGSVFHFGPYRILRDGKPVAVLFAQERSYISKVDELLERIEHIGALETAEEMRREKFEQQRMKDEELFKEDIERRRKIRAKLDEAIKRRINLYRLHAQDSEAQQLQDKFDECERMDVSSAYNHEQ